MADFEANCQEHHPTINVYLWELLEIKLPYDNKIVGFSVGDFLLTLINFKCNLTVYFHNMDFDVRFLLNELCKRFTPIDIKEKLFNNSFKVYMDQFNRIFCVQILTFGRMIKILDSYKLIGKKVSDLGDKLELDYNKYYQFTQMEDVPQKMLDYLHRDCVNVAPYLLNLKTNAWTKSGIAIQSLQGSLDPDIWKEYYEPELSDDMVEISRKSYKGGFCAVNPKYKSVKVTGVYEHDINSSYPFIMSNPIACGLPTIYKKMPVFKGKRRYLLKVFIREGILKKGRVPIISTGHVIFNRGEHYYDQDLPIWNQTFWVWEKEFNFWKKFYDLKFKIKEWWEFEARSDFKPWVKDLYERRLLAKRNGDEVNELRYKTILNSAYGKLAERNTHESKQLQECFGDCMQHFLYGSKYCLYLIQEEKKTTRNIFTASYITSMARCRLFEIIDKIGDDFVYGDTDSIYAKFLLDKLIKIDDIELGAWKSKFYGDFKALKQKCYLKCNDDLDSNEFGKLTLTMAGATDDLKNAILKEIGPDFDKFKIGLKILNGNTKTFSNKYGVIFKKYDFKIEE